MSDWVVIPRDVRIERMREMVVRFHRHIQKRFDNLALANYRLVDVPSWPGDWDPPQPPQNQLGEPYQWNTTMAGFTPIGKTAPACPFTHRATYLAALPFMSAEFAGSTLVEADYCFRMTDENYDDAFDKYSALTHRYAFPIDGASNDAVTIRLLSGFRYSAPPIALDICAGARTDCPFWNALLPYTREIVLNTPFMHWVWRNRFFLSSKERGWLEEYIHEFIPCMWLTKCSLPEDCGPTLALCDVPCVKSSKRNDYTALPTNKCFDLLDGSSSSEEELIAHGTFIGDESGLQRDIRNLPFFIRNAGGVGYYAANVSETDALVEEDTNEEVWYEIDVPDSSAEEFYSEFDFVPDLIECWWATRCPPIFRPSNERVLPHVPVVGNDNRWVKLFDNKQSRALYFEQNVVDKYPNLKKWDSATMWQKLKGPAYAIVRLHINKMRLSWRLRIFNAIHRVKCRDSAGAVFRYICALIDEHERIEQAIVRLTWLQQFEMKIVSAHPHPSLRVSERLNPQIKFDPEIPTPPCLPRMRHENSLKAG